MQRKKTFNAFGALKASLLSVLMSFCVIAAFAQSGTVKGTVTDDTGEPVIGANVVEKGSTNGTITDIDGNYTLQVTNMNGVLQFSFIGYNTTEENIGGRTTINVQLNSGVINLGEVVAIGYGTQTRREITGSVANVDEASFNKGISRDASDLLRGKVAGLSITSGNADITQGSMIRLRGTSTLMNDQGPMIVIDGVPGGDMSSVAPSDIESISVLKDASSQAIYGSRAAGGVILITTKKGTGARTTVNYDGYVSMDVAANKPDMLNASEWVSVNNQLGHQDQIADIVNNYHADTDWFGEVLRTGFTQSHSVSLTGGSSTSNYRGSYTYLDRQGVAKNNSLRRHSFRFQVQQRALENKLRLTLDASGTLTDMSRPQGGDFVRAYNMIPLYPVYNADGSWFEGATGALFNEYDMGNPVHAMAENYDKTRSSVFTGRGEIQYDIIESLNVKANLFKSRSANDQDVWNAATNYAGAGSNSNATRNNWTNDRIGMEWTVNFDKTFGNHKVGALAGYSWENNEYRSHYTYVEDFAVTSMGADNIQTGNSLKVGNATSSHNAYKLISFFGRATYSYNERYMLTATIRRDGSSKFGKNHKWGTFPSVSAAWGISQEPFMQNVKWVDDLKLRAGYGVTGNQDGLSPYKSLELYESYGTYITNGSTATAFRVSQNANPDLKWESTSMFNVGVDFSLFSGRVGGTIEYYSKKTTDMLYNYSVPTPTYVYNTIAANVGDMTNKGIEVSLNWNVIKTRDFDWTTTLTLSHNENKVTRLSNDFYATSAIYTGNPWIRGQSGQTSHIVEEGRSLGNFYNLKCTGLDADGHFIYEDVNGDGVISDDDRTYIGNALPKAEFGWTNNFTWKNWDFSFFLRGTLGNKVLNNPLAAYGTPNYITGTNAMKNDNLTKISESAKVSSFWIENGSFARLDNMTLGYTFDTKKIDWLSKARLYVTAQNLFVITGYKGLDPEVNYSSTSGMSPGIESREYFPKSRSFTFGVNLTF